MKLVARTIIGPFLVCTVLGACSGSSPTKSVDVRSEAAPGGETATDSGTHQASGEKRPRLDNLFGSDALSQAPSTLDFVPVPVADASSNDALGPTSVTSYAPDGRALAIYFGDSGIAPFTVREQRTAFKSMAELKSWALSLTTLPGSEAKVTILQDSGGAEYVVLAGSGAQSFIWQTDSGTRVDVLTFEPTTVDQLVSIGEAVAKTSKLTPEPATQS